jgi:hypothetical protein
MVCAECTIGLEIFLATPDGPPFWRGQIEGRFGTFGDIVNLSARLVHSLGRTYHSPKNHFGHT